MKEKLFIDSTEVHSPHVFAIRNGEAFLGYKTVPTDDFHYMQIPFTPEKGGSLVENPKAPLEHAIAFASRKHAGQLDKTGEPHILHPMRVMLALNDPFARQVAVLHDVLEDTDATRSELLHEGFDIKVVEGVVAISKKNGEDYETYLRRLAKNLIALRVKRADISDNMSPTRLYKMTPEKRIKLRDKYTFAINLLDKLAGE